MEFDIETWVPYRCDFKPITTNSLFSEALGRIAALALRVESEFLYMQTPDGSPAGTLVPENLIHPCTAAGMSVGFAMVFSYSVRMEGVLFSLANEEDDLGAGVAACGIWKDSILVDECKVLVVASENPFFDSDVFLSSLDRLLSGEDVREGGNVPYFAEKFGYRRFSIPYETDDVTQLQIARLLLEFEETGSFDGLASELSLGCLKGDFC